MANVKQLDDRGELFRVMGSVDVAFVILDRENGFSWRVEDSRGEYIGTWDNRDVAISAARDWVDIGQVLDEDEEFDMSDIEADADTLRSVGWGTDEDYGYAEDVL